MTPQASRA